MSTCLLSPVHRVAWRFLIGALVLAPCAALAQERQMGGGVGITVFTDRDFRGTTATYRTDVPALSRDFNDRIVSLRVAAGERWEVCEHENYRGRCVVVSGEERDLNRNAWARMISSMRRVRNTNPPPGPPSVRPPADWYIVLFDRPLYQGRPTNLTGPMPDLTRRVTRTQSVTVGKGQWQLCEGTNFSGRCATVSRSVAHLGVIGLRDRIGSLRPVVSPPR